MLLKRFYKNDGELDYISLAHTGIHAEQNFSVGLVTHGITEGWITIDGDTLKLRAVPEDLLYTIKRHPGRYCEHCGEKLTDDDSGEMARLHVAMHHKDAPAPQGNPAGYVKINHFECVLAAEQHEKFCVKDKARAPQFPKRES